MRISDWSSDVCSSDLDPGRGRALALFKPGLRARGLRSRSTGDPALLLPGSAEQLLLGAPWHHRHEYVVACAVDAEPHGELESPRGLPHVDIAAVGTEPNVEHPSITGLVAQRECTRLRNEDHPTAHPPQAHSRP